MKTAKSKKGLEAVYEGHSHGYTNIYFKTSLLLVRICNKVFNICSH